MAHTTTPTILDNYLPSGINRIVVFPKSSTATTCFTVDVDDSTIEYYTTYPGSIVDLNVTGIKNLASKVEAAGEELYIVPGLPTAYEKAKAPGLRKRPKRLYRSSWEFPGDRKIPSTAVLGAGGFALSGLCSVGLLGWELAALIPSIVVGLGTGFGLHLEGMHREHKDQNARTHYDNELARADRVLALSGLDSELVRSVARIDDALTTLRTYGLSTGDYHAAVTDELDTFIRSTLTRRHHAAELHKTEKILAGLTDDDITNDHELFRVSNHQNQHLVKRNEAATQANHALQRLSKIAGHATHEARTAGAKIAAANHLSKKPTAD